MRAQTAGAARAIRTMIAPALGDEQRRAVEAPLDVCVAICGAPGTGKTAALHARAQRAVARFPGAEPLWLPDRGAFGRYAAGVLKLAGSEVALVDDVAAETTFAAACAPLFALNWEEIVSEQLDPEVPGLRSPGRFLESAFRLIRKLREARIGPDQFLAGALAGATEFYANPPNFADPALLLAVGEAYRDSLAVAAPELQRQYRREIDLAKILAKLYARYAEMAVSERHMTGRDAIEAAIARLQADESLRERLRARHRFAFVDDAQELTAGECEFLRALFGSGLPGVTLGGDSGSSFSGAPPGGGSTAMADAAVRIELAQQHRSPPAIELACRQLIAPAPPVPGDVEPALELFRAATPRAEAAFIAARVREWLDSGTPAERIAVIFRSVATIEPYEAALLDRDVPVVTGGDVNVFTDRRALDALALLWNVYDPFRHDWLLRTLGCNAFALSDASLAILCGEPPSPQTPLFVFEDEPSPTARSSRWDPKRDLRLGWNVVHGDRDAELSPDARSRVERFRTLRRGWIEAMHREPFAPFARRVWKDALAREGAPGSARARAQTLVLERLLERIEAFLREDLGRTAGDALAYANRRARSDLESCEDAGRADGVRLLSLEAARGREFDRVVVADVRAGAFPRWYSPDAFLFSPRLGMIPKENAGEAHASRTARFTYYMARNKVREKYNARERRALVYALRRARSSALVTASQPPTRGVAAPEFLEELRNARLPGTREIER
jgi:superfamily I DNA/RNA helicase